VRSVGGHAAPYDAGSIVVERFEPAEDVTAGLEERFADQSDRLQRVLEQIGADARVGELDGEYCAGAHSISLGGRVKVAGIAQRAMRGGALTSAIITVHGGPWLRAMIERIYAALELDVDPATAGALDEAVAVDADDLAARIRAAYRPATLRALDDALLDAARELAPRHSAG
jgi:lipoate-protein ligase A